MILLKDDAVKDGVCTLNCISLSRISAQINIYTGKWEKMKSYVKRHCSQVLDSIVSFLVYKKNRPCANDHVTIQTNAIRFL